MAFLWGGAFGALGGSDVGGILIVLGVVISCLFMIGSFSRRGSGKMGLMEFGVGAFCGFILSGSLSMLIKIM